MNRVSDIAFKHISLNSIKVNDRKRPYHFSVSFSVKRTCERNTLKKTFRADVAAKDIPKHIPKFCEEIDDSFDGGKIIESNKESLIPSNLSPDNKDHKNPPATKNNCPNDKMDYNTVITVLTAAILSGDFMDVCTDTSYLTVEQANGVLEVELDLSDFQKRKMMLHCVALNNYYRRLKLYEAKNKKGLKSFARKYAINVVPGISDRSMRRIITLRKKGFFFRCRCDVLCSFFSLEWPRGNGKNAWLAL
jgi:hypothetical protein